MVDAEPTQQAPRACAAWRHVGGVAADQGVGSPSRLAKPNFSASAPPSPPPATWPVRSALRCVEAVEVRGVGRKVTPRSRARCSVAIELRVVRGTVAVGFVPMQPRPCAETASSPKYLGCGDVGQCRCLLGSSIRVPWTARSWRRSKSNGGRATAGRPPEPHPLGGPLRATRPPGHDPLGADAPASLEPARPGVRSTRSRADPDDEPRDARKTRPRPARWRRGRAIAPGPGRDTPRRDGPGTLKLRQGGETPVGRWSPPGPRSSGHVGRAAPPGGWSSPPTGALSAIGLVPPNAARRINPDGDGRSSTGRGGSVALRPDRAPSAPVRGREAERSCVPTARVRLCVTSGSPGCCTTFCCDRPRPGLVTAPQGPSLRGRP